MGHIPPGGRRLRGHSPFQPEVQARMALKLHTPPQPGPQKPLQQIIGQEDEDHTGDDQQRQGPLEVPEAGEDQEGTVCCRSRRQDQQGETTALNPGSASPAGALGAGKELSSALRSISRSENACPYCVKRLLGDWGNSSVVEACPACPRPWQIDEKGPCTLLESGGRNSTMASTELLA